MTKVAERTVLENPAAPGTGIVVAAGDEIPAFAGGWIENTPNKVDAAANHETADAADQAATPPIPDGTVRPGSGSPEAARLAAEAAARVAANRADYDKRVQNELDPGNWLQPPAGETPFEPTPEPTTPTPPATAPGSMTVAELDAAYGAADGYPATGNKAEKVKFAKAQAGS